MTKYEINLLLRAFIGDCARNNIVLAHRLEATPLEIGQQEMQIDEFMEALNNYV